MLKKLGVAALTALTLAGAAVAASSTADARPYGWRGGHHRGYGGVGIGLGLATGLALGGAYGAYGYPSYG